MMDINQYGTCVRNFVNGFLGFPRGRVVGKGELRTWPKRWEADPVATSQGTTVRLVCLLLAAVAQGGPESQGPWPWAEDVRERSESWSGWHWWKLVDAVASVEFGWSSHKPTARLRPPWPVGRCGCICMIYRLTPALMSCGRPVGRSGKMPGRWSVPSSNRRRMPRSWTGGGTTHPALDRAVWLVWPRQGPQRIVRTILRNHAARPGLIDIHPDACYCRQTDIPTHIKPASWFHPSPWYRCKLRTCAAYVAAFQNGRPGVV